jgi:predicted glycosyltransferase
MTALAEIPTPTTSAQPGPIRVLLYSHDSLGLGHVRRNLALAHVLSTQLPGITGRPVTGLLLTSLDGLADQLPENFDILALPGVTKRNGAYYPRGMAVSRQRLQRMRASLLTAAVLEFGPDLMIVDRHAFGVDGELSEALQQLRTHRPDATIVLGLREVLDDPAVAAKEWQRLEIDQVRAVFDQIWVYGDPAVHDPVRSGEIPRSLHGMVRHTGYLSLGRPDGPATEITPPYLVTMVGGGSDGEHVCAQAARAEVPPGHRHLIVTGPQMSECDRQRIAATAAPGTRVTDRVPDGLSLVRRAAAVVSMAGYNTVTEIMSTDVPSLLVPREVPRREQAIRAAALERVGAMETVSADALSPAYITEWFAHAVGTRVDRSRLQRNGLNRVVQLTASLLMTANASTHVG